MITNSEEIKDGIDILDVFEYYFKVERRGSNYFICCPFHTDKTPSLSINNQKGFWKCFSCGRGGDAISMLREYKGLTYSESLEKLAEISGIEVRYSKKEITVIDKLYALHKEIEEGSKISNHPYLDERGIDRETARNFNLGVVTKIKNYPKPLLEKSGLLSNSGYFLFKNCLIFPIKTLRGKTIAFSGRSLDNNQAKYKNSSNSLIYTKSKHLFGLYQAKSYIQKQGFVYLVEGNFDVLRLHQIKIRNVCAVLGTALTSEQINLLKKLTKKVCIIYDGDLAGVKATIKAGFALISSNIKVLVVPLPFKKDPDEFFKSLCHFKDYVKKHKIDLFSYIFKLNKFKTMDSFQKISFIETILLGISEVTGARKQYLLEEISKLSKLSPEDLSKQVQQNVKNYETKQVQVENKAEHKALSILMLLKTRPDFLKKFDFSIFKDKNIGLVYKKALSSEFDIRLFINETLSDKVVTSIQKYYQNLLTADLEKEYEDMLKEILVGLKKACIKNEISKNKEKLVGSTGNANSIMTALNELSKQLIEVEEMI